MIPLAESGLVEAELRALDQGKNRTLSTSIGTSGAVVNVAMTPGN